MKSINIRVPFVFSESLNPSRIFTVGDQFLAEHVFSAHINDDSNSTNQNRFSEVKVNSVSRIIEIKLLRKVIQSDGSELLPLAIVESMRQALKGSSHSQIASLHPVVELNKNTIKIAFDKLPINFLHLLTLPDFFIYSLNQIPIDGATAPKHSTSGPYSFKELTRSRATLEVNPNFPADLIANKVKTVLIDSYSASDTHILLQNLDSKKDHLVFLYGYALTNSDLELIKSKNFKLRLSSNEWLVHLGFQPKVCLEDRTLIGQVIDKNRDAIAAKANLGSPAYSIMPSDRQYGLTSDQYKALTKPSSQTKLTGKLTIGTLDEWQKIPLFNETLDILKSKLGIVVKVFDRANMGKLYSNEVDIYLSPLGISPADPLSHLTLLSKGDPIFKDLLNDNLIIKLITEENQAKFIEHTHELESEILKQRLIVPLFHFPSVVAESRLFERDETLSSQWGIQAWSYKINSEN